nr:nickel-dependent hydrogenase large subunit [Oculatellaceae cyanobacterium Prado106]
MKTIVIDPITRIEGHAKISIFLNAANEVEDARFHVVEYRGFEKFCEGRPFTEMAGITARICGICPVSHLLASAKTGDKILAVQVPVAAAKLRRLMNLGQIIQSHALSFFHLSSPDFLLGWDSDPAKRNVFGLIASDPDLARAGIRLRQFGQMVIELLGARKIHAAWAVPGGVRSPLSDDAHDVPSSPDFHSGSSPRSVVPTSNDSPRSIDFLSVSSTSSSPVPHSPPFLPTRATAMSEYVIPADATAEVLKAMVVDAEAKLVVIQDKVDKAVDDAALA